MTRERSADLTDLREWRRDPALAGLLREWTDVPAERLRVEGMRWLDQLAVGWPARADVFATASCFSAPSAGPGFTAVCLASRAGLFADGHPDGTVRIWDLETLRPLARFRAHDAQVTGLAFDPGGKLLVTASRDRTAKIWAVETGTLLKRLSGHIDEILSVGFHPEGGMVATTSRDGTVALWEVPSGVHLEGLVKWPPEYLAEGKEVHIFPVMCLAFAPDGKTLATGTSRSLVLWDLETRRECGVWTEHRGPVTALAYTKDSRRLVSGSQDRGVRVWDVPGRRPLFALPGAVGAVQWLRVLPGDETVLGMISQGALQLWHLGRRQVLSTLCPIAETVTSIDHDPRGDLLCCGLEGGEVRLLEWVGARALLRRAARAFRTGKEPVPAARAYELLEDWPAAAEQYERAGDLPAAARLFDRAGRSARAGEAYLRAGAPADAARAFVAAGDPLAAAAAWALAGHVEEAVPLYRAVLAAPASPDDPSPWIAAWRLAALLFPASKTGEASRSSPSGWSDRDAVLQRARGALEEFGSCAPRVPSARLFPALDALSTFGLAAGREAETKEAFETVLGDPSRSAADRVAVLEAYRRAAEAFGNRSLTVDLDRRWEQARVAAEQEAERDRLRAVDSAALTAPTAAADPDPASGADKGELLSFLWHSRANAKCARLLHELAIRYPTEITLRVLKRSVPLQRFHLLETFLSQRNVRGYEVILQFRGEQAREARMAFESLIRTNSAFL